MASPINVLFNDSKIVLTFRDRDPYLINKVATSIIVDSWKLLTENYKGTQPNLGWLALGTYSQDLSTITFPQGLSDKHWQKTGISSTELEGIKRYIYKIKAQKSQAPLEVQLQHIVHGAILLSTLQEVSAKNLNTIVRYNAQRNVSLQHFMEHPFAFRPKGVPISVIASIATQLGFDEDYCVKGMAAYVIDEVMNTQGDMYVSLETIMFHLTRLGLCTNRQRIWDLLNTPNSKHIQFKCVSTDEIYLQYVYDIQDYIVDKLLDYLEQDAENWKELKENSKITTAIDQWESTNGIQLSKPQRKAVEWFLLGRRIFSVCGGAGTGKSLVIRVMCELGEALYNWKITCLAPTGKASMRLPKGSTIHRYLAEVEMKEVTKASPDPPDVIIVDETSMADVTLVKNLLESSTPRQWVFVGDDAQLPPVRWGNFYKEIIGSKAISHVRLKHTFRNKLGILELANKIRNGEKLTKQDLNNSEVTTFLEPVDLEDTITTMTGNPPPQIISPTREFGSGGVSKLNTIMHQKIFGSTAGVHPCPSETVIVTKNYYDPDKGKLAASNGDVGQFVEYKKKFAYIKLDRTGTTVKVSKEDVELAHALTVHKTQGSEYDVVILVLLDVPRMLATRELLYTAVTRAKKKLVIISDPQTLQLCTKQQMSLRKCKLSEYLDVCLA